MSETSKRWDRGVWLALTKQ